MRQFYTFFNKAFSKIKIQVSSLGIIKLGYMRRAQRRPIFKLDFSFVGIEVVLGCKCTVVVSTFQSIVLNC